MRFILYFGSNERAKDVVREALQRFRRSLAVKYGIEEELGTLSPDFIVDLDDTCTTTKVVVTYSLASGKIVALFEGLDEDRQAFFLADFVSAFLSCLSQGLKQTGSKRCDEQERPSKHKLKNSFPVRLY